MVNGQPIQTEDESGNREAISDDLTVLPPSESTESEGSQNSSPPTAETATTLNDSRWTLNSVELEVLKSKAGLVAGALADFVTARGWVVRDEVPYTPPNMRTCRALKIILIVPEYDVVAVETPDGLTFDVVAVDDLTAFPPSESE